MALLRRLKRPDFEGEIRSIWFDPEHFPKNKMAALSKSLPAKMSTTDRAAFMADVVHIVQMRKWLCRSTAAAARRDQIRFVAEKSRELLKAIAAVHSDSWGDVRALSDEFVFDEITPMEVSDATKCAIFRREFWPHIWDSAQDIESIFFHAANQLTPDKQSRPSIAHSKAFVSEIATAYVNVTGKCPPYSKETWFPLFISQASLIANFGDIGRDIVETAVKGLKAPV